MPRMALESSCKFGRIHMVVFDVLPIRADFVSPCSSPLPMAQRPKLPKFQLISSIEGMESWPASPWSHRASLVDFSQIFPTYCQSGRISFRRGYVEIGASDTPLASPMIGPSNPRLRTLFWLSTAWPAFPPALPCLALPCLASLACLPACLLLPALSVSPSP